MSIIKLLVNHKWAVLKIVVMILVFLYIWLNLISKYTYKYIQDNWSYYQTKPYFAPLAGFFQKDNKEGVVVAGVKGILQLIWVYIKMFFKQLIKPFQYIIDIVYKIIDGIRATLDKFREQLAVIRKMLLSILEEAMSRLQNLGSTLIALFMRLREIMKRSFATYQTMIYTVQTMGLTMKSMMGGPIGDMASLAANLGYVMTFFLFGPILAPLMFPSLYYCLFFCFHPDTEIKLRNYGLAKMKDIQLETALIRGYVTGKMVFYQPQPQILYKNKEDLVTGSHYILDGFWQPMKNYAKAERTDITSPLLYCLATSNHCIITPSGHYLDFDETSDSENLWLQKIKLLSMLNSQHTEEEITYDRDHLYQEGFLADDLAFGNITAEDLPYKCHYTRNNLVGIGQWIATPDVRWYSHKISNIRVTGSVIINEGDKWIPVYQSNQFTEITDQIMGDTRFNYLTNWVSTDGSLYLDGFVARDLLEIHDVSYHDYGTSLSLSKMTHIASSGTPFS